MLQRCRPTAVLSAVLAVSAPATVGLVLLAPSASAVAEDAVRPSAPVAADPLLVKRLVAPAQPAARPTVRVAAARALPTAVRPATVVRAPGVLPRRVPVLRPKPVVKAPVAAPAPAPAPKPAVTSSSTAARGDDYPWKSATTNDPDTWGFTKRQCVSFAAHRLAQSGKALDNASQHWGSALNWDDVARSRGVAVSATPRVGAIAHWNAHEASRVYANGSSTANGTFTAGQYGHVGYVAKVYSDGSVLVEQYNLGGNRSYSAMRMTAPRYLRF